MKAALLIFEEKGFKESTISQIADQAGLHVQTFYRHFGSKDDLITEIWRQSFRRFKNHFDNRGDASTMASWRKYVAIEAKKAASTNYPWGLQDKLVPMVTAEAQVYQDQYRDLLAEGLAQDLDVNIKNDKRPLLIACALYDGIGMVRRTWTGKKITQQAYIQSLFEVVDATALMMDSLS